MLQVYKNVKSTNAEFQFKSPEEALSYIKGINRTDLDTITKIRELGKGNPVSDLLKTTLPAVLWNFQSTGCRNASCITASTGLIYFDIDLNSTYQFNKEYFYASWKSVTGTGYGALVKVSGVNQDNFKEAYHVIADTLKIAYDAATKKATQLNILSYDPEISINADCQVIDFSYCNSKIDVEKEIEKNIQSINQNNYFKNSEWVDTFSRLRFDNLEEKKNEIKIEYDENGVCDLKQEKIHFTQIYFPQLILPGTRHRTLQRIMIQLLTLNPNASKGQLRFFLGKINNTKCYPPKDLSEVDKLSNSCYKAKDSFKLFPNKTRRFFFEDVFLDLKTKRSLIRSYINKDVAENNQREVFNAMKDLVKSGKPFKIKELIGLTSIKTPRTVLKHLETLKKEFSDWEWDLLKTNAKI